MMTIKYFSRWCATVVALIGWHGFYDASVFAEDVVIKSPGIVAVDTVNSIQATNSVAMTNNPEADKGWKEVMKASQSPMIPVEWQQKQPTLEEQQAFFVPLLTQGADKARDFYTKYPNHPKADEAKKKEVMLLSIAAKRFGDTNQVARLDKLDKTILAVESPATQKELSPEDQEVRKQLPEIQKLVNGLPGTLNQLEAKAHELLKEYPKHQIGFELLMIASQMEQGEKAKAVLQEIAANEAAPEQFRNEAMDKLKQLDRLGKPVEIKFTAIDGRKVDLSQMQGKVVLVDFWATWCGPCVAEIPHVKEVYEKFHPKGFEVVGISLDQEQESLEKFVKEKELPWPQYFDGKGWENKFAQQYGIRGIPAMWLVDKRGNLQSVNARGDLEGTVEKLLAE
ncbi:TlpA family protein disulfide reductase [Pedosphaera parvula]|uniref:Alkyl hydroperoxide reductase/ Thiol specific antioxidant/ Mal allergen n=1 Tax=Pedosphaera parvula (strain Ellin514) TaxID=320771 RepID=B9XPQ1_PEDPL|nr:TlpA disulfide reductase family protein [Pedosphaera parvula]EEF58174.1 alkyl hydroperoxide reductase/ Thiol specific antioxidant/ Mal allergen [Pedosphaera parvula Ellin514]